jgi:hypothetical protein
MEVHAMNRLPADTNTDISSILTECVQRGFLPPLHVAIVGVNGSAVVCRYTFTEQGDELNGETLTTYDDGSGGLSAPINIMISDARGEAARVTIGFDGSSRFAHWLYLMTAGDAPRARLYEYGVLY